jgi:hypothetical protein
MVIRDGFRPLSMGAGIWDGTCAAGSEGARGLGGGGFAVVARTLACVGEASGAGLAPALGGRPILPTGATPHIAYTGSHRQRLATLDFPEAISLRSLLLKE